jgi:DNA-binding transcriptional MerR regulator
MNDESTENPKALTVGELARRTGLTVRTLHHYDEIGLLEPSDRTAAGYRLYGRREVERLQQIVSLKALGMGLAEIGELLQRPEVTLGSVLDSHIASLRASIGEKQRLLARLEALAESHRRPWNDDEEGIALDDLLETLEMTTMHEKYYSEEQLETLAARREELGDDAIRSVEAEWPRLIAAVRTEMEKGTDPADDEVQRLAARWDELVGMFTGGDPGISRSLGEMVQGEPQMMEKNGLDPALFEYLGRARAARQS